MHRFGGGRLFGWLLGLALPVALLFLTGLTTPAPQPRAIVPPSAHARLAEPPPLEVRRRVETTLRRGQTLAEVLDHLGVEGAAGQAAAAAAARFVDLRQLRPGLRLAALVAPGDRVEGLDLVLEGKGVVSLARQEERWNGSFRPFARRVETRSVRGQLDGGFEAAVERAGAPGELAFAVAEVLQWDLDFNRDLRRGDTFEILFEETWVEGRRDGIGDVLAVRYLNRGRPVEAYRFDRGEYFDGEGRPLQKLFLRSPLPFSRVTSRFSSRRFHPVLKVHRPHYGVDYGAPEGTPVRVTAAGSVVSAGWDGGGGRTVKVRHPNGFLTAYLHLSRFASGLGAGDRVSQGEVIGYVGSTGLASGPHLDYRVQQNGRWIDPLSLKSVPADPVPTARLAAFRGLRDAMRTALASGGPFAPPVAEAKAVLAAARPVDSSSLPAAYGAAPAAGR